MMFRNIKTLNRLKTFNERYDYLKLEGIVGVSTFGYDRYLNQMLYTSKRWKQTRDEVIIRDNGCDLGCADFPIHGKIMVHHMNVITIEDIENSNDVVFDPDFLICTSLNTHNAIHYGDSNLLPKAPIERRKNDTCPWL